MNSFGVSFSKEENGVARLVLSRPEKQNAFDDAMIRRMDEIFLALNDDKDIRVLHLMSEGKNFSAGADLSWMKRMAGYSYEENYQDAQMLASMMFRLASLTQMTIAQVQGSAFGGAVGLIACCDVAFATTAAKFCLSETKLGLVPAVISPYVIDAIGARAARRYFQSAEIFTAERAMELGLVSEVFEENALHFEVNNFIDHSLKNAPIAMREAKRLVSDVVAHDGGNALLNFTSARIAKIRVSQEGQEGLRAFLEKRQPVWQE